MCSVNSIKAELWLRWCNHQPWFPVELDRPFGGWGWGGGVQALKEEGKQPWERKRIFTPLGSQESHQPTSSGGSRTLWVQGRAKSVFSGQLLVPEKLSRASFVEERKHDLGRWSCLQAYPIALDWRSYCLREEIKAQHEGPDHGEAGGEGRSPHRANTFKVHSTQTWPHWHSKHSICTNLSYHTTSNAYQDGCNLRPTNFTQFRE